MRTLPILLLLGTLPVAAPAGAQLAAEPPAPAPVGGAAALRPVEPLAPPGGPLVLGLPVPGSPQVALRLSVPVEEGPGEAGAARVLQLLALDRARSAAALMGARVEASRTPWGVAYTVEGAAADFDHLAYVLREAVAEPSPDAVRFERARDRALSEALRLRETAAGRLASTLRERVGPSTPPPEGTPASLRALERSTLREVWRRTHRRDRMTLVVVGDVPHELVLASFSGVGSGHRGATEPPSGPAPTGEGVRTEVLRSWYGEAREAGDVRDPRGLVAATLLADHLRAATDGRTETRLEVWEVGPRRALAVMAAAYPGEARGLEAVVQGVLGQALAAAEPAAVRDAVERVRAILLLGARTPSGLAALVGRYHDATGDPEGAAVLVEALERVDAASLRTFLEELAARPPARAEVRP